MSPAEGPARLGVLGGTFDPPHAGHLAVARFVREQFGFDRIEFVPAYIPPHKPGRPPTSPFHRFTMTAIATLGEPGLLASDRELARGGVSYTVDTLREMQAANPGCRIAFILGTDQFAEIAGWRDPEGIVSEFELIVVRRPGTIFDIKGVPVAVAGAYREGRIHEGKMDPVALSSTEIRARIRAGESISGLVSPGVQQYIDRYQLYRAGG